MAQPGILQQEVLTYMPKIVRNQVQKIMYFPNRGYPKRTLYVYATDGTLFSSRVRIRFSVSFVSGYAHVFILLSVVIVTLPVILRT